MYETARGGKCIINYGDAMVSTGVRTLLSRQSDDLIVNLKINNNRQLLAVA